MSDEANGVHGSIGGETRTHAARVTEVAALVVGGFWLGPGVAFARAQHAEGSARRNGPSGLLQGFFREEVRTRHGSRVS
jgi:hypothetical protein